MAMTAAQLNVIINASGAKAVIGDLRDVDQALGRTGTSAERSERSLRSLNDTVSGAEVALTAFGAGLAYAGDAALDQTQLIIGLNAAFGDAADEYIKFADQIASQSIFNDDDIMRGQRYFATLRENYELTDAQIRDLMQTTADLASAYGTSFEDASSRITAAIRGEGEAAEYLGLTMNQQAIDRDNLTLTMSNQEAAQFRLNALYDQTGRYSGTAQRLAESEVGTRARLTNAFQDNAQAAGEFIGPLGSIVAGAGMAASGIGSMTGALGAMQRVVGTITPGLAAIATNPIFLGGAALAGGVVIWDKVSDAMGRSEREQKALDESTANLTETLNDMRVVMGELAGANRFEATINGWTSTIDQFSAKLAQAQADWEDGPENGLGWLGELGAVDPAWAVNPAGVAEELMKQLTLTDGEARRVNESLTALAPLFTNTAIDQEALSEAINGLYQEFLRTGDAQALISGLEGINANSAELLETVNALTDAFNGLNAAQQLFSLDMLDLRLAGDGELASQLTRINDLMLGLGDTSAWTADQQELFAAAQDKINERVRQGSLDADFAGDRIAELNFLYLSGQISAQSYTTQLLELAGANVEAYAAGSQLAVGLGLVETGLDGAADAANAAGVVFGSVTADLVAMGEAADASAMAMGEAFGTATVDRMGEYRDMVAGVTDAMLNLTGNAGYLSRVNLSGLGTDATNAAEGVQDLAIGLDSVLAIFSQIDAMGNRYQGAVNVVDALIGEPGKWAAIDDLYDAGRIGLDEYTAAVERGIRIQERAAGVELSLNEIRVDQLPLLEQTSLAYANYIDSIAAMNAQDQAVALGWMDGNLQSRVQQFAELGNQLTALGPAGADAMQQVIDGIVATDPVLTAMLDDLGLIEQQANGTYRIDVDALGAMDSTEHLIASIDALTIAMGGVPPLDVEVRGWDNLDAVTRDVEDLAALSAQELMIDIALRLGGGDGETSPAEALRRQFLLHPIEIPATVTPPDDEDPAAGIRENARNNPITYPVRLNIAGMGEAAGGAVASAADQALAALGLANTTIELDIVANNEQALGMITAMQAFDGMVIASPIVSIDGDNTPALGVITATAGFDGQTIATPMVMIDGDNSAAVAVIEATSGYDGMVIATAYVDVVARQIGSGNAIANSIIAGTRDGLGIHSPSTEFEDIAMWSARGFERGWEREFSDPSIGASVSGTAQLGYEWASGASATGSSRGGPGNTSVVINVQGHVIGSNRSELTAWAEEDLLPAIGDVLEERWEGLITA